MGLKDELGIRPAGHTLFSRSIRRATATRPGAWLLSRTLRHLDHVAHTLTGGRMTMTEGMVGVPSVFLTTIGARTGQQRTSHLMAVPFGENLAVIGSNFGQSHHPGWVHNLVRDPHSIVRYGDHRVSALARELTGAAAEQVWGEARSIYQGFAIYPALAGERRIRVFALEPAAG